MNIIIYNKVTKEIVLAGELSSKFSAGTPSVTIADGTTLSNINWDNLAWFLTDDDFPEGFFVKQGPMTGYSKKFDELSLVDARLDTLKQCVKDLASKKILALAPEWKQRNMMATGLALLNKGKENWTAEETAVVAQIDAAWAALKTIRDASNAIEAELGNDINYDWENSPLWG